jgi:hypothetical protein
MDYLVADGGLRVVFERRDDRWGHRIELASAEGQFVPVMTSVEGQTGVDGPPSPALQELQLHEMPHGMREVLGVGASGSCHWSLACGARRRADEAAPATRLSVEVACRVREGRPPLVSTYRLLRPANVVAATATSISLAFADRTIVVSSCDAVLAAEADRFAIVANDSSSDATRRTVQWSYSVMLVDA